MRKIIVCGSRAALRRTAADKNQIENENEKKRKNVPARSCTRMLSHMRAARVTCVPVHTITITLKWWNKTLEMNKTMSREMHNAENTSCADFNFFFVCSSLPRRSRFVAFFHIAWQWVVRSFDLQQVKIQFLCHGDQKFMQIVCRSFRISTNFSAAWHNTSRDTRRHMQAQIPLNSCMNATRII